MNEITESQKMMAVSEVVCSTIRQGTRVEQPSVIRRGLAKWVEDEYVEELFPRVVSRLAFLHGIIVR